MKTNKTSRFPRIAAILLVAFGMVGCTSYKFDTVEFDITGRIPPASGPVPGRYIDTNLSITGPFGGSVKSKKPYSVHLDHTDKSFTFAAVEITKVNVNYHVGTNDPGAAAVLLPLRSDFRHHVSVNSGGPPPKYTIETPMRVVSMRIPDVISRDEPFTLLIEGRFIKDNGKTIPFRIRESYQPVIDKSTRSWSEVISGI